MAVNITEADAYIAQWVIVTEDWADADEASKTRLLNVASRTLTVKFPKYTIPDAAVYETAAVFATVFNDTNKLAQQGVQAFSLSGVASFTFRYGPKELAELIPETAIDLLGDDPANGELPKPSKRRIGWSVL
ncbi:hypothetical protein [Brevibacillus brevis]|uniref:hypothetical protein n=1 Tax=Brevibacillus brevis TaxID=1393 RepID=UPI00165E23B0|nr:hypothetical protein [Brevibacillus brevis]